MGQRIISKSPAEDAWGITLKLLKQRQADLGISRYRIAHVSGVAESTIQRIWEGSLVPGVVLFYKILTALEINPHYVWKEDDTMPYPQWPDSSEN